MNYTFKNLSLLETALTHSSVGLAFSCDRLAFLGDSIIELVIREYLYKMSPQLREGEMTQIKCCMVNEKTLSKITDKLGVSINANTNITDKIKCDVFEAIVGAVYLDAGLEIAQQFILNFWDVFDQKISAPDINYKEKLQIYVQKMKERLPEYILVGKSGPDHMPKFTWGVKVILKGVIKVGQGVGSTKLEAQQNAAKNVLEKLI